MIDWLDSFDTNLFVVIHKMLANPVFDVLMPFLSGNWMFVPLLLALIIGLLWKGGLRGRIFVFLALLSVCVGDSMIVESLKVLIHRPRPFVYLDDVRLLTGKANEFASMPSAHAANWGALTLLTFLYYRRWTWLVAPVALGVGYSRIYNGVHHPFDVLVGLIIGAGCAAALAVCVNMAWGWIGRRRFPAAWEQCPSLLNPPRTTQKSGSKGDIHLSDEQWMWLGYVTIVVLLFARLAYLGGGLIELTGDEAYQWTWSKHPALSYYSKPPMIALAQFAGTSLWGDSEFGVRFLSPVAAAILSLVMLRFFAQETNPRTGFLLVLVCCATPLLAVGSTLMTVDPLNVLFWILAMVAGWRAVQVRGTTKQWALVGLWMGLGFLSKYTSLFQLLAFAMFFVLWPSARAHLRRPGPYVALLVNAVCALPVLIWNAQHDWITITHVNERAAIGGHMEFTLRYLGEFLGSELGVLNPFFFIPMLVVSVVFWRTPQRRDPRMLYFFCMSASVFVPYLLQSLHARVLPNWIAPAVIPMLCMVILYQYNLRQLYPMPWWLKTGLIVGLVMTVLLHETRLVGKLLGGPVPVAADPLRRARGWREMATIVNNARLKLEQEGRPTLIIGAHYSIVGLLSFYIPEARPEVRGTPLVVYKEEPQYPSGKLVPENQYYFWPEYRYTTRKDWNAIYIVVDFDWPKISTPPDNLGLAKKIHTQMELLGSEVEAWKPLAPMPAPYWLTLQYSNVTSLGVYHADFDGRPNWWFQMWECRGAR